MRAVVDAASSERDRLVLRVLGDGGGMRISEALALRRHVRRLPGLAQPQEPRVQIVNACSTPLEWLTLPGELLAWAQANNLAKTAPLFLSRKHGDDGATALP